MKKFINTSDSDHGEGKSICTFERSPAGYGLFSGVLDSTVLEDGKTKRSGYCNIKSKRLKVNATISYLYIIGDW